MLAILSIGIDREMLDPAAGNEALERQLVYVQGLPARSAHVIKAPGGADPTDRALADGRLTLHPVPAPHAALFPIRAARRALALGRAENFDVVVAQEPFLSGPAALWVARRLRLPLVVGAFSDQVANPDWANASLATRLADQVGRFVYARAQAIRADSRAVAERLRAAGFAQVRFVPFLITNSDQLARAQPEAAGLRAKLLAGAEGPLLLTVARLVAEKNLPLMLAVVERVAGALPGVRLAVIGDGPERRGLEDRAAPLGDRVQFLGRQPHAALAAYYQAADLFLLSSDVESSARVLTEAQLAGTPVLTTASAGATEVVADGRTGRVVPVGDMAAFAAALLDLSGDRQRLAAMRAAAASHAAGQGGTAAVLDGLRELYAAARKARR
jgi:glycosyltransferase involved in cell wall biosynthesis